MKNKFTLFLTALIIISAPAAGFAAARAEAPWLMNPEVRIKDLADLEGARSNQLVGVGVVVGLQGTGDKAQMTAQMMGNMMQQFGVTLDPKMLSTKNAAAVTITADLPAYAREGQPIDVIVNAMADAKSLQGGTLLQAPLKAADGTVYAVAQGPVLVGGYAVQGAAASLSKNIATVGRIPGGAIVERGVPTDFYVGGQIALNLRNPDFTTAQRIADIVNSAFGPIAAPTDAGRVIMNIPGEYMSAPAAFLAKMEKLSIKPDSTARVAINERTGTVVMGGEVKISSVAVAHGGLTVSVKETPSVVQPDAFSQGVTAVESRTDIQVDENGQNRQFVALPATTTVKDLVNALNSIGASPRDVIAILQAMNQAGALHGELVNM
ncbi:MAG: flagellar basal body P-ring protein FlgI [Synergistaceae bacterium]|nr:flagellar basal body P-ring protein FlgI [Synergistaceae bacterium]